MSVIYGTTQEFGSSAQFIAGSLSAFTITLVNHPNGSKPTHEFWTPDITAHATPASAPDLIAGREYEFKTLTSNTTTAAQWADIGLVKLGGSDGKTPQLPVVGDKFIAAKDGVLPGNPIPFNATFTAGAAAVLTYPGGAQAGLAKISNSIQARASIVTIGKVTTTDAGVSSSVRILTENSGHEDYARANDGALPQGDAGWPTGAEAELLRALQVIDGEIGVDDDPIDPSTNPTGTKWRVEQFVF